MAMYTTKNDLPEQTRTRMIELLNARLADAIDLQTQMKQAHWNVKGPNFIALHELFDKVNEDVEDYVDLIAERVGAARRHRPRHGALGGAALALAEYPLTIADGAITSRRWRRRCRRSASRRARRSTAATSCATRTAPTSSPRSRAASTSGCGSSRRTSRPSAEPCRPRRRSRTPSSSSTGCA